MLGLWAYITSLEQMDTSLAVRLGACLKKWSEVKEEGGFARVNSVWRGWKELRVQDTRNG